MLFSLLSVTAGSGDLAQSPPALRVVGANCYQRSRAADICDFDCYWLS